MRLFLSSIFLIPFVVAPSLNAAPITVNDNGNPWEVFHFRESRGATSVFSGPLGPIDQLVFGITNVSPNGKGEDFGERVSDFGTTIIARQEGTEIGVPFIPDDVEQNRFGAAVPYQDSLTGSWELTLTNGERVIDAPPPDQIVINTPSVGNIAAPARVADVTLSQSTGITTPTISWTNREENPDEILVTVFDLERRNEVSGFANRVYFISVPEGANEVTIPADAALREDGLYSVAISTRVLRSDENGTAGTNPSGSSQAGAALATGETYFDFPTKDVGAVDVLLPELSFGPEGEIIYNFNNEVVAEQIQYYDPLVAIGYDYQIGEQDPFFNSFILPEIGDDMFSLHLWDGTEYAFEQDVLAGTEYFLGDGTDRFRILGIETGAALDPLDPTAFVTGLSFAADGRFTGTMSPIVANVPLPAGILLLGGALGGLAFSRRRQRAA